MNTVKRSDPPPAPLRALGLLALLTLPALAGCAAPSGVNEESYPGYAQAPSAPPPSDAEFSAFAAALAAAARPRANVTGEDAYDRFLAAAVGWARDGLTEADRARPLNASTPAAQAALQGLASLANATRGSDKEVSATPLVRLALVERWGAAGDGVDEVARELVALARSEVASANASAHAARANATAGGRNALLRAEAVLSLALTQLDSAESALAQIRREADAAQSALDARASAAGVRFWLGEAARHAGSEPLALPSDLAERAAPTIARAEAALARARSGDARLALSASDLAFGLSLVRALERAGLPEGVFAASQGLRESLLVFELTERGTPPTTVEARAAWEEAAANVRTYRDAQRYDRALASVESERNPFGDATWRVETLRAYAAVALLREISEERERTFSPGFAPS